jgi:excisionase family DNA binding protein
VAEEEVTAAAEPALPAADGPPPASTVSAPPPFVSTEPAAPAPGITSTLPQPVEAPLAAPEAADGAAALEERLPPAGLAAAPARDAGEAGSVRQNIDEAALMRERLPQHIDMLLRIPTNEVAQNSYKSPFRESREELIRRLIDPQLTLEETARVLGVCPTTVRRYTNRGMLHCHRTPGNQRRFRMSDVLRFVEQYGDRIDRAAEARQLEEAA